MGSMSLFHWFINVVIALIVLPRVIEPRRLGAMTRSVGKFVLIPLLILGPFVLVFLVLAGVFTFYARMQHFPEIQVGDGVQGTQVSISSNGILVKTEPPAAPAPVAATPAPAPAAPPPAPLPQKPPPSADPTGPSGAAKVLAAVQRAFLTAMHSMPSPKQPPAAKPILAESPAASSPAAPSKRPAWIDTPPQPTADRYEVAVVAGPWKTPMECERAMEGEIEEAVGYYVAWRIGEEASSEVSLPADYARQHLVKEQWLEKINTSVGEMFNLHALLSFDRQVEGKLQDVWKETLVGARVVLAASILGGGLLLLSVIYGYLKVDLATAGAYRGRLRFAAGAMVLVLAAAGAVLWHWAGAIRNV